MHTALALSPYHRRWTDACRCLRLVAASSVPPVLRQRSTAELRLEPHGMEVEEVVGLADLRRGMALKGQSCVGLGHALTVVNDLNGRAPGIDYSDVDVLGAGVDSILYEFLYDRGGALDDLTGRDLVGY